jgi:hypothetical protein
MKTIQHKFVEFIPDTLEEGILYITLEYATALHKCACGCGMEVVTPLSPNDWKMIFNGKAVSLYPSIGNWQFTCRSHYWIENNQIIDANRWPFTTRIPETKNEDAKDSKKYGRKKNKKKKARFFFKFKKKS